MVLMDTCDDESGWFWMCCGCGVDTPYQTTVRYNRKGYDEFWNKSEDSQAYIDLDDYFYNAYPEFKS